MGSRVLVVIGAVSLALSALLGGSPARADEGVLGRYVGRWEVRLKTLQPKPSDQTYVETYEWTLGRKFVRAKIEQKADGTEDLVVAGYDPKTKGYPFWIFSSTGTFVYLPPATWDARARVMEWKSPPQMDISYSGRCLFPNENTRRCTVLVKDWKGRVLLEQESTAMRRGQ